MKLVLSRHGRIDFHAWEDRPIDEMKAAYAELLEILEAEGSAKGDAGA